MPYNALSGYELAKIIGDKVTEALRGHLDYGVGICYDNPEFMVTVEFHAMELEPRFAAVSGRVETKTPPGVERAPRRSEVKIDSGVMSEPDKLRLEHDLVVPERQVSDRTGEISEFKPDQSPW